MKFSSLLPVLLLFISCGNEDHKAVTTQDSMLVIHDNGARDSSGHRAFIEMKSREIESLDTVTANGNFLHYSIGDDSLVVLHWGNKLFDRTYATGWIPDFWPATFHEEFKDGLLLIQHCGQPCWVGWWLPLNRTDSIRQFFMPLFTDTKRQRILWLKDDSPDNQCMISFLIKHSDTCITLDSISPSSYPLERFSSVSFTATGVWITYKKTLGINDTIEPLRKKFIPLRF